MSDRLNKEKQEAHFYEIKLQGNPWIYVLSAPYNNGWYLLTSTHISKKTLDKDSLVFQLGIPPRLTSSFSVSFNDYDQLRLICALSILIPSV
ncbi:unnamed protein product [Adineta steineri]|uniref:Uncharacterized protein n=1 Tax=Adineta steineri TaxID=433720 RepID=A0A814DTL4_9BILA|nr:unnamed protein product [Adineta steineri]CAF1006818.1 unnamed protein product [Adineta steineri]